MWRGRRRRGEVGSGSGMRSRLGGGRVGARSLGRGTSGLTRTTRFGGGGWRSTLLILGLVILLVVNTLRLRVPFFWVCWLGLDFGGFSLNIYSKWRK